LYELNQFGLNILIYLSRPYFRDADEI